MSNYDNTNSGVLFKNDKKGNEKAPDYKGKVNIEGKEKELLDWMRANGVGKVILRLNRSTWYVHIRYVYITLPCALWSI